jgi:hypothetical protein
MHELISLSFDIHFFNTHHNISKQRVFSVVCKEKDIDSVHFIIEHLSTLYMEYNTNHCSLYEPPQKNIRVSNIYIYSASAKCVNFVFYY